MYLWLGVESGIQGSDANDLLGFVRDLLLKIPNKDIDLIVEGEDAEALIDALAQVNFKPVNVRCRSSVRT